MKLFKGKVLRAWKDIEGYEGYYQVSTDGRVRSLDRWVIYSNGRARFTKGKELNTITDKDGYFKAHLSKNGKCKYYRVHRLVAEAFISNPNNKPEVDHIDTDKQNNNVNNLRWASSKDNSNNQLTLQNYSKARKGKTHSEKSRKLISINNRGKNIGINNGKSKPVYCVELDRIWGSILQCAKELGIDKGCVGDCCRGIRKNCKGYHFRYATIEEIQKL